MKTILELAVKSIITISIFVVLLFVIAYIWQEKLMYFPEKLNKDHRFSFNAAFEEVNYVMDDEVILHGVLFKSKLSKGIVYYLHGNAGSVNSWGHISKIFTDLNYDLLIIDYRGYGKSGGKIVSEKQMYDDVQKVYDNLKIEYPENKIIVLGYSIGTGMASMLAATNNPKQLILMAPYYNLPDLVKHTYRIFPNFMVRYKFYSNKFVAETKCPVYLFHGMNDELIPYHSAERLWELCKPNGKLILIDKQGHNGLNENPIFQSELKEVLQ